MVFVHYNFPPLPLALVVFPSYNLPRKKPDNFLCLNLGVTDFDLLFLYM